MFGRVGISFSSSFLSRRRRRRRRRSRGVTIEKHVSEKNLCRNLGTVLVENFMKRQA